MNPLSELHISENGSFKNSNEGYNPEVAEQMESFDGTIEGNQSQRTQLVEWLNGILPYLSLPLEASEEDLRACLIDGTVLCGILNRLSPGSIEMGGISESHLENLKRFLAAMEEMGLPRFELSDLEQVIVLFELMEPIPPDLVFTSIWTDQTWTDLHSFLGSMDAVLQCLQTLRAHFNFNIGGENIRNYSRKKWNLCEVECLEGFDRSQGDASSHGEHSDEFVEERRNSLDSKFQHVLRRSVFSEPSPASIHHVGHRFQEGFQLKQGGYADFPAAKISELVEQKSLENTPTHLLFSILINILDGSIERKNGDVPHRVAFLLRKIIQEIEQRISTQAENLKNQNNLYKAREEKYQSRIRVLETLATGTTEENRVVMHQLQQIKIENTKIEERKKLEEQDVDRLMKEKDRSDNEILALKEELEMARKTHEKHCLQLETQAKETKVELEKKLKELENLLTDSKKKVKELEAFSESKSRRWKRKELRYQNFVDSQFGALQELRVASDSIKREVLKTHRTYSEEFNYLGMKLKGLTEAAENYHMVLEENRRLYNEVQDLKGNIRVYCRIRPFLPGQSEKYTTIEYIGENGELVVVNPAKQGKDSRRLFKFNKVFSPAATQEEVFLDTQPLIRSVLDGYNVCIFAYGQTGSGKTYTMTGPDVSSKVDWGVNYRALNDLFHISQSRKSSIMYEVGVQMVEIYNEQVRDLLSSDGSQKRLGIWSTTQPNGLAVPDASMHPVKSTADVLELMNIGLMNRAVGATALNERSSRSHSILTVHVRGLDLETDAVLRGSLHLVDLAGSERVLRSEATGDRLREAQHINKSLSALGDVIFALAQKSPHVPYRNSKLTQVLQSSLGGQAKTLMFVQLNPDVDSYSETISTLKFAERVSGVELGAARSNKEGRDVRELMEQVAFLRDSNAKKDLEIEQLQQVNVNSTSGKRGMNSLRYGSSSPRRHSIGASRQSHRLPQGKGSGLVQKAASDLDNCSEYSDKHSEAGSLPSIDDFRHKECFAQSKLAGGDVGQNFTEDIELLGFGDADSEERLSDISDGGLSMGTETDGSISSIVEFTLFPEAVKPAENTEKIEKLTMPSKLPRIPQKQGPLRSSRLPSSSKSASKVASSSRKTPAVASSSSTKLTKRWQ